MHRSLFLFAALTSHAEVVTTTGFMKGDLLEWDGTESAGNLTVRGADHRVLRCSFDSLTYFERDRKRTSMAAITAGDRLELVTDASAAISNKCYARTVHVLPPARPPLPPYVARALQSRRTAFLDSVAPRGSVALAGLVMRRTPEAIWLRTRANGEKTILLRQDTRYLKGGSTVEAGALEVNTRVFIRAGKTIENDLEAFQIIWGEIFQAR